MHGGTPGNEMVPPVSHLVQHSAGFSAHPTRMLDGFPDWAGPLWESVLKRLVINQRKKGNARLLQRIDQDSGGADQEQSERSKDTHFCKIVI